MEQPVTAEIVDRAQLGMSRKVAWRADRGDHFVADEPAVGVLKVSRPDSDGDLYVLIGFDAPVDGYDPDPDIRMIPLKMIELRRQPV
ncbi:hypothetical protein CK224_23390 [Mesorhizobium sp. WSM3862]|nr:hypothetical protein CK224_23390 [Mesorhizobium sp. WSM3862]